MASLGTTARGLLLGALVCLPRLAMADAAPGLVVLVFDNPALVKPVRVWQVAEPRAELLAPVMRRDLSLVLRGRLAVPFADDWEIRAEADDGVRLWLEGQMIIDGWDQPGTRTGTVRAGGARSLLLELEYFQDGGPARLRLEWRAGGGEWAVIPAAAFSHTAADRAVMEGRFAALMRDYERVVATVVNPQPGRWPSVHFVQQGARPLLRMEFPDVADFTCDAWMYESEMDFLGARDLGGGRLETRHRLHSAPEVLILSVVEPGLGSIEITARAVRADGSPADLPAGEPPPDLCLQLRKAPAFAAFPEPYASFMRRCFVFTRSGRTFLDRTRRVPTTRFPADDPVNHPPWVQVYLPEWVGPETRLPFPWAGVSPDRLTATVAGVVSRDASHLAAIACDSATSISQVWVDCLHNDPEWGRDSAGQPVWRLKIYVMPNDPDALLRRVAEDFPLARRQPAFAGD